MKRNNIILQFGDQKISIAQHFEEPKSPHSEPELIVNEIAIIDHIGVCNPIEFAPNVESFFAAIGQAINAPPRGKQ